MQLATQHARGLIVGAVLAAPPLVVFSALFASADPVFRGAVQSIRPGSAASHAALSVLVTWASAGYLWTLAAGRREPAPRIPVLALGATPVMVPLAATAGLFTVFLVTQAGSLFGGATYVESHTGLTYAEYARGGFFQLVSAALLVLPMVYAAPLLAAQDPGSDTRSLRALMTVQLALTALVLVSALWRLGLYVGAYGLTEDRLYGLAVLGWIGGVLGIFAVTVLRGNHRGVPIRCVVAAAIVLAALNLSNPAAVVARYNLSHDRARQDVEHLARLGHDAIPVLGSRMPELPPGLQCRLTLELRTQRFEERAADWRGWNLGRARAHATLRSLPAVTCP
jgi:hypothetical protein